MIRLIFDNVQFDKVLADYPLVLVYFSGENCNVCASLKTKIEMLVEQQFPTVDIIEIKTEQAPELISRYSVFTVPVVMFFVEGRDYIREVRSFSVVELAQKMEKIINIYKD